MTKRKTKIKPKDLRIIVAGLFGLSVALFWVVFLVQQDQLKKTKIFYEGETGALKDQIKSLEEKNEEIEKVISKNKQELGKFELNTEFFKEGRVDKTKVEVIEKGEKLNSFTANGKVDARFFKKTDKNLYVGILPKNRGAIGYETFRALYRIEIATGKVMKARTQITTTPKDKNEIFINDLTGDDKYLAYVLGRNIYIDDLYSGTNIHQFPVGPEYFHIGGAVFSLDGTKLAYGATTSYEKKQGAKAAIYVINLATGEQKEIITGSGGFYNITDWKNENEINYELLDFNSGV